MELVPRPRLAPLLAIARSQRPRLALVVAALAVALALGCGRGEPAGQGPGSAAAPGREAAGSAGSAGSVATGPRPATLARVATERACLDALVALRDAMVGSGGFQAPDPAMVDRALCADLYSAQACSDAWHAVERDRTAVGNILARCAAAYCPTLPAPRPAACAASADPDDPAGALAELDRAVLLADGSSPEVAASLARRALVFTPITMVVTPPAIDPGRLDPAATKARLSIEVYAGTLSIDGVEVSSAELGRRIVAAVAADPDVAITVVVGTDLPYSRVIEVLDAVKAAGGTNFALSSR